jgi:hypothetical protein
MRKITFETAAKTIDINGNVFELLQNSTEIIDAVPGLQARCANLTSDNKSAKKDSAAALANEGIAYIDKILGPGAAKKVLGEKASDFMSVFRLLGAIYRAIIEDYTNDIKESYGV